MQKPSLKALSTPKALNTVELIILTTRFQVIFKTEH